MSSATSGRVEQKIVVHGQPWWRNDNLHTGLFSDGSPESVRPVWWTLHQHHDESIRGDTPRRLTMNEEISNLGTGGERVLYE
jgi:hypothetical protein